MQGFHHILLDIYKYLMMQSSIWQMVRTRTSEELSLDIPKGSVGRGRGQVPRGGAHLDHLSAWSNYWPLRMT
jgi:hypothetical protein